MSSPSYLSPQYKILLITLLCLRLCQGVCLNIRHLDDDTPAAAVVPTPTPEHKRHGYHRAELIGAWIIITVVPVACIVFFCATAPRVRQREILFKLFHRDGVFNAPAAAVEMKDLELGSTAGSSSSPRAAGSSSWWDRLRGRSKAAARAGGGMAATVIGKAKPVIKSAAAKIDRSRVKRHHRKQTQRGFRQLGGQDGGDHVKYNIYDDEDNTTFGGFDGPSPSSLSSSPSSSWSSSLVSSSRDESPSSSSAAAAAAAAAAAVVGASSSLDLIGYYDYYRREGEVHQEFRKEAVVTTTGDGVQASESTVRRVSFDAPPAVDVEEGPQITEVSNDNNSSNSGATMPTMVVEEPPDESPRGRVRASTSSSSYSGTSRRTSGMILSDDDERYLSANESNCYQSCSDGSRSDDEEEEEEMLELGESSFTTESSGPDVITGGASNSSSDDVTHRKGDGKKRPSTLS
ncbi:hypothetical protein FOZ61_001272 [Perkinsus olseni]|uniref:Uncharacterized protein n=1 Tax=Perkinsus olseni TaxID=32597 RepID=A0A7J6LXD4_PEROL|nr:hypothetical protein FOZ61_001272 [Perkinsus olseni]